MDYDSDLPRKITEVLVRKVPDNQQVSTWKSYVVPPSEGSVVLGIHWPRIQSMLSREQQHLYPSL